MQSTKQKTTATQAENSTVSKFVIQNITIILGAASLLFTGSSLWFKVEDTGKDNKTAIENFRNVIDIEHQKIEQEIEEKFDLINQSLNSLIEAQNSNTQYLNDEDDGVRSDFINADIAIKELMLLHVELLNTKIKMHTHK